MNKTVRDGSLILFCLGYNVARQHSLARVKLLTMMSSKTAFKVLTILLALFLAMFFALPLKHVARFGASGCIRLSEDVAIFCILTVTLSLGVTLAMTISLIPALRHLTRRIFFGFLVACLMFNLGVVAYSLW